MPGAMAGSTFYNLLLTVLWAGLVASTAFDWGDYAALECPQPWQLFLLVDYILVLIMCLLVRGPVLGGHLPLACMFSRPSCASFKPGSHWLVLRQP